MNKSLFLMFHWATQMYFDLDELNLHNTILCTHKVTLKLFGKSGTFTHLQLIHNYLINCSVVLLSKK